MLAEFISRPYLTGLFENKREATLTRITSLAIVLLAAQTMKTLLPAFSSTNVADGIFRRFVF